MGSALMGSLQFFWERDFLGIPVNPLHQKLGDSSRKWWKVSETLATAPKRLGGGKSKKLASSPHLRRKIRDPSIAGCVCGLLRVDCELQNLDPSIACCNCGLIAG